MDTEQDPFVVAIVGAGLFGLSTLERIIANTPEFNPASAREIRIHLVDPYLGRGSRTWPVDQPAQLWMNSHSGRMTLFTDDSSTCRGPVRKGPTLQEWAADAGETLSVDVTLDGLVGPVSPYRWASRALMGKYLVWFLDHVEGSAPENIRIHRHRREAIRVVSASHEDRDFEWLWLKGEADPIRCDRVILAQGRPPFRLSGDQESQRRTFRSCGVGYEPPGPATEEKAARVRPGESVLLRGMGLTFFDYLQLFTTVRGGTFHRLADGALRYEPSGLEPRIFAVSRRGVCPRPLRWWPVGKALTSCAAPLFTSSELFVRLAQRSDREEALREARQRMEAEVCHFYYHELLTTGEAASEGTWPRFRAQFASAFAGSPEWREQILAEYVASEDRLDLPRLVDPLDGQLFPDLASLQAWMRRHIASATNQVLSKKNAGDLAMRSALSCMYEAVFRSAGEDPSDRSVEFFGEIAQWVRDVVGTLTGGAPWPRQLELQALSRSGVVTFLGRGASMSVDQEAGSVRWASGSAPASVEVDHVVESRQASAPLRLTTDTVLQEMSRRAGGGSGRSAGTAVGQTRREQRLNVAESGNLLRGDAGASRTVYVVGFDTSVPVHTPGLPRAGTDSDIFHMTDRVARHVLASMPRAERELTGSEEQQ
ncbi:MULTISPECIES: FAD/NAD(P)-binding protein [unclassified Streptomyces]|uniref:FAD/NAD(P)-binding protein n=1 Tax=unclassified Streptomyces TaxID=2593676 RepID=UPI00131CABDD|nr:MULTISPECIES: FAD/NAD(P)-binding protein [unclassified Streptomyces]